MRKTTDAPPADPVECGRMIRHVRGAGIALALLAPLAAPPSAASAAPPPRYYLALGDSIAYGFPTGTGYVDLVAARLRGVVTVNYSCPGESTVTFRVSCPLRGDGAGSQLSAARTFLRRHPGRVELVTVSLNGNDITDFVRSCGGDVECVRRQAPDAVAQYAARLRSILRELRAAAPAARMVVVGAYDPNIDDLAFADPLFASVNAAQAAAAASVRARFADPFPAFNPPGDVAAERAALCSLTLLCTAGDPHPSEAGYRALAEIVWRAVCLPGGRGGDPPGRGPVS
jgi:lysophospholipase L1-like esterase